MKPIELAHTCKVKLTVYECKKTDRFFIKGGQGCKYHQYHPQLKADEITILGSVIPKNNIAVHSDLYNISSFVSLSMRLMHEQEGIQVGYSTMQRLRTNRNEQVMTLDPESINNVCNETTACDRYKRC